MKTTEKNLLVVVGSKNPVKLTAVQQSLDELFQDVAVRVTGLSVDSGVANQPGSDEETFQGAKNRVQNLMREVAAFDYLVGIEGGITKRSAQTEAFAWVYIADKYLRTSYSRTATFLLPTKITDLLDKGYELGEANDRVFNTHNSKQNNGAIGLLTQDRISRTNLYQPAVTMAMIPFLPENKCLYK